MLNFKSRLKYGSTGLCYEDEGSFENNTAHIKEQNYPWWNDGRNNDNTMYDNDNNQ